MTTAAARHKPPARTPGTPWNSRDRAIGAAADIMRRDGYAAMTMERVAAESGVAKTTLYRHWPTKAALCMDLYFDVAARELRDPDTGDVARDLKDIAATVVHLQTRTIAGAALIGVIAEAHINPATSASVLAQFAERRRALTRTVIARGIARGELRKGTNVDLLIDAIGGGVTFRLLQGHAPLTRTFTDALVDLALDGCRAPRKRVAR